MGQKKGKPEEGSKEWHEEQARLYQHKMGMERVSRVQNWVSLAAMDIAKLPESARMAAVQDMVCLLVRGSDMQDSFFSAVPVKSSCRVCGATLTNPISVRLNIGPVCGGHGYRHETVAAVVAELNAAALKDNPSETGYILRRPSGGEVQTNVPRHVIHHSPCGYEWGYGGSGPADLALNMLEDALLRAGHVEHDRMVDCFEGRCFSLSWRAHQDFKWQRISPLHPQGPHVIGVSEVQAWLADWQEEKTQDEMVGVL